MAKLNPVEISNWCTVALQLIALGLTTVAKVRAAAVDAGWSADDARLVALDQEYARRIAARRAEA